MTDYGEVMNFDLKKNPIPRDQTAANVIYKGGFFEPFKHKSTEKLSTTPFPTRKPPIGCPDFTGIRKGRLTVIGMYNGVEVGAKSFRKGGRSKPQGHGWVCRCDCGNYTVRKSRSVRKKSYDSCIECMQLYKKRHGTER